MFTASWYLLSPILWSVFNLFGQSFSEPPMPTHNRLFSESPTFGGTQHYLQSEKPEDHLNCRYFTNTQNMQNSEKYGNKKPIKTQGNTHKQHA